MTKYPLYSLIALLAMVAALVLILIYGDKGNSEVILFVTVLLANFPGLVSAFFAERNNNAIHNGVIVEKTRQGATKAIEESQVMTRTGPVEIAQLQALTELLARVTKVEDKQNGTSS